MIPILRFAAVILICLAALIQNSHAATVRIYGTVTDSCGVRIPRAAVMFIDGADTTRTLSDSLGFYEVFLSDSQTGIGEQPSAFSLSQNYPNPFNPSTVIEFSLGAPGMAELDIFSITGQNVRTLVRGYETAGSHRVIWDGRDASGMYAASGVYLYRLRSGGQVTVKKMLLMEGGGGVPAPPARKPGLETGTREYELVAEKVGGTYSPSLSLPVAFSMNAFHATVTVSFEQDMLNRDIAFSDKYEPYILFFDSGHFRHEFAYPGDSLRIVLVGKHENVLPETAAVTTLSQSGDRESVLLADASPYTRYTYQYCSRSMDYPASGQAVLTTTISTAVSNNGSINVSFPADSLVAVYAYAWGDSATASIAIADSVECFGNATFWDIHYIRWRDTWYFWEYNYDQTSRIFFTPYKEVITTFNSALEDDQIQGILDDLSFIDSKPLISRPTVFRCYWDDERSVVDILHEITKYVDSIVRATPVTHGCIE